MLKRIVFLLCALPLLGQAQITVSKSSFSNGKATGTDGVNTVTSLVGSFSSSSNVSVAINAPTVAASAITFSNVLSTSMTVNFTPGNGTQRLAVAKAGSAPDFTPADDVSYSGDLGNGISVVYSGSGSTFNLSQLQPDTDYWVTIFEFNSEGAQVKYMVSSAPVAMQRTLALPLVYVTTPVNGAVDVNASVSVTAKTVTGATIYTTEISSDPGFTNAKVRSGSKTQLFDSLQYNTLYYARAKTDLRADYGQVTTFTTRTAESLAYVTTPANNAVNINNTTLSITSATVLYATQYTIQLSESADFTTIAFEVTGPTKTLAFAGLKYSTLYYNRVRTNLSPVYGAAGNFTTRAAEPFAYVTSPANNSIGIVTSRTITSNTVPGAASYTIQLSETSDFAVVAFEATGPTRTLSFSGLKYGTTYYNRVTTDVSLTYGAVNHFTTVTAGSLAYVTSPSNGAIDRAISLSITSSDVPGATSYTIELSEFPDFSPVAFQVTGASHTLAFSGLKYNTLYYNRVTTNLSPTPGVVRTFSTRSAASLAYVISPGDGGTNKPLSLSVTSNTVPGAASYTIELSDAADFSKGSLFSYTGPSPTTIVSGLDYGVTYYSRVLTDVSAQYGLIKSFTTLTAESISYVTVPVNNAVNVSVNPAVKVNNVPGAATYTIELSTTPDFSTIAFMMSGSSRTQNFTGLTTGTKYYSRVITELTTQYGAVKNFTTAGIPPPRMRSPLDGAETETPVVQEFDVRVYPNPFREKLVMYIESTDQEAELSLTDMTGRSVHRSQEPTNTFIEINKPMAAGVYLLQVRTTHYDKVVRVVKIE